MGIVAKGNSVKEVSRQPSSQDLRKSPSECLSGYGQALSPILACRDVREALRLGGRPRGA